MIERQEGDRLVFEKPPSNRGCFLVLALFLLPFALLPLAGHTPGLHGFESGVPWPLAILSLLIFGSMSTLMLYYSGPTKLSIDPRSRTYVLVTGFPLAPKTWSGTLDDFRCTCVEWAPSQYSGGYNVAIRHQPPGPRMLRIAYYTNDLAPIEAHERQEMEAIL